MEDWTMSMFALQYIYFIVIQLQWVAATLKVFVYLITNSLRMIFLHLFLNLFSCSCRLKCSHHHFNYKLVLFILNSLLIVAYMHVLALKFEVVCFTYIVFVNYHIDGLENNPHFVDGHLIT